MTLIGKQRIVIGMYDGFGMDYMAASPLPAFRFMAEHGFFKPVSAVFPTVTNTNSASICCGTWPKEHGITGNSYFNEQSGEADYMENADFLCVPTVIQRAAERREVGTAHVQSKNHSSPGAWRGDRGGRGGSACRMDRALRQTGKHLQS
jgi:predicted AlkP superfamily pyrophosphatase or phosphodiesterase